MEESQFLMYDKTVPKGVDYIEWIFSKDQIKEAITIEKFKSDNKNIPIETYGVVGDLLSIIYNLSVCGFGCRGGDHRIEYILGKAYNTGVASLKLLRLGFYDESLGLIRSISETINLLCLFRVDSKAYSEWISLGERDRIRQFSPAKIRDRLEAKGLKVPITKDYYSKLCQVGVHVNPDTKPSGYNKHGLALVGGLVIDHAPVAILNDLATNLFYCVLMGSSCILDKKEFMSLSEDLRSMVGKIGELTIMSIEEYITNVK